MGNGSLVNGDNAAALAQLGIQSGMEDANARSKAILEALLKGKQAQADVTNKINQEQGLQNVSLEGLKKVQDISPDGSGAKAGDLSFTKDPYSGMVAKLQAQGPAQARSFIKSAAGAYKPINDQLDASQSTLDALNQKNAASDKLALINEARLAAGAGGSRAIKSIMDSLTGGKTAGSDFQSTLNYFQNTPNIPTMQDAQRDAIRESVYNRLPQLEQQHRQAAAQLTQQGALVAPQTDTGALTSSITNPVESKLQTLKKMQQEYNQQRAAMQKAGNAPISNPSQADANPSTVDRLKSLLFGASAKPAPAAPQQGASLQDMAKQELLRRRGGK